MIDFVGTPILENRILVGHANHIFAYPKYVFFYDKKFRKLGIPTKDMAPM